MHTILKRRHSLVGKNMLPLCKKLRQFKGKEVPVFARLKATLPTEDLPEKELVGHLRDLTGENEKEILEMADREVSESNLRLLLHFAIIYANEVGQPSGQELRIPVTPVDTDGEDQSTETVAPAAKKAKRDGNSTPGPSIPKSQASLPAKDEIKVLKEKVRRLSLQNEPSEPLILLSLDELATTARERNHEDADMFSELAHQAHRNQGKVNLGLFTLGVLGGKASDIVSKALSKCVKEKSDTKETSPNSMPAASQPEMVSPLQGVYPQPPAFQMRPSYYGQYNHPYMSMPYMYGFPRQNKPRQRFNAPRPVGPCLFCDAMGHLVKDCVKLQALKQKGN